MKKVCIILLGCAVFLSMLAAPSHATIISFNPSATEVALGSSVSVDLMISGLGEYSPDSLGAYDLDIIFDPAILSFQNVVFGTSLDIWGFDMNPRDAVLADPGVLDIYEISFDLTEDLDTFQPGSFLLATLTFNTLGAGSSVLQTYIDYLSDATGFNSLPADVVDGSVTVTSAAPVPEPTSLLLLGCGMLGIGLFRAKRSK